jgi:2-dehydro-3-deoxyphosphogluconate aldolase/(4S)-4-hydroxy-2-oxoglutarate aldolase
MATYKRHKVVQAMLESGLLPLFYHADAAICREVLAACHAGGVRCVEFTNRGDFAHERFAELARYAQAELPGLMLGAGSVLDAATAALYMQLGAQFVVSPAFDAETARCCHRRKVLYIPGCGTVSEVSEAESAGAEIVKLFPGEVLGPAFIKALLGPMPWSLLMPTGGVEPTEESLRAWFGAGAACVGMGSRLISAELIAARDWPALAAKVASCLALIQTCRMK